MRPRPVCLVTGAARRIGRAIAVELAANGWDIAVHYRHSREEARETVRACVALGARAREFQADLSMEDACGKLFDDVVAGLGRADSVVNNASLFQVDAAASFTYAAMERHLRANTAPAVLLTNALHRHLQSRDAEGCVVNLLDQKLWNPNPDYFSYTLSKAALQCATVMLAQACAPRLRVCAVAPGVTLASAEMSAAQFAAAQRLTPLQRSSTPQDIARAVRYLLEAPAVTGTTLLVDGGQHLAAQPRDVVFLTQGATGAAK